jgi:hypothetical protein
LNAVVLTAVAICFVFFVLQIVAIGQLTGKRRSTGEKYLALAFVAGWFLIDWLFGVTAWLVIEGFVLVVAIPVGVVHLTILLIQESREV